MKKAVILIAFMSLPILSFGKNALYDTAKHDIILTDVEMIQPQTETLLVLDTFSRTDVTNLSYKKSIDLISIKAYRRSLQIKTKEIKSC